MVWLGHNELRSKWPHINMGKSYKLLIKWGLIKMVGFVQRTFWKAFLLTHWGRVTHSVSKLTIIGSDNGLSPDRRQAIIWTNAGLLLIGPLGTDFNEILIPILTFSFKKMHLKVSSAKRRPFCLGILNEISLMFVLKGAVDNIVSANGLVRNRRQAITWNSADPAHWCLCASPGHNGLNI